MTGNASKAIFVLGSCLFEPSDHLLKRVQQQFDLHPLAIEDAGKAHQHSKLEQYGDGARRLDGKGFPESYDLSALLRFLSDVRRAAFSASSNVFAASSNVLANSIDLASEGSSGSSGGLG